MADKLYCAYFVEIQNIKESFDQDEMVTEEVTSSVPDAGEEAAEFLNNLGVNVDDVALVVADSGWSDMVPVLTSKQRRTLRIRIETVRATKRLQLNKHRPDVRDLFNAASLTDIPLDPPPDYDGLDSSTTDGACVSRSHGAYTLTGAKESFEMGIFIPPPDYAMNDDEETGSQGANNHTHMDTHKDSKSASDPTGSLTRVDDLSRKDRKMLDALALIELTAILDEFNIKFSRQKAKQKVKENGVFGVSIQTLLDKDHKKNPGLKVPLVFQQLIQHLEQVGLQEEGLLRIPGRQGKIKELRREWDNLYSRGKNISLEYVAVHDAAGLLKLFLRELPAPLLTLEKVDAFVQVDKIRDEQKQLSALNFLILLLPQVNREMLHMLFIFLDKVANEPANRMTTENVSMILAPNLFFPTSAVNYSRPETLDFEMKLAAATSKITLLLLTNFNTLQMVPSSLLAQIRQKHESSHVQSASALLRLLGNKDKSGDGNHASRTSQYSAVGILVHPAEAASITVESSGSDVKVPVSSATTASDVVQFIARSPGIQRKKHSLSSEAAGDQSFLYEVGGNIGERRLDPATNIMSVCQVNPHAKYVVRTHQPHS